jgi:hypothetical protein
MKFLFRMLCIARVLFVRELYQAATVIYQSYQRFHQFVSNQLVLIQDPSLLLVDKLFFARSEQVCEIVRN